MGCKTSKILHDEPCTCQHRKQAKQVKHVKNEDIVVVRSPSPASSFYNSNTSTYSAESTESAYSNSDESTSRQPFLRPTCDHPSHYEENQAFQTSQAQTSQFQSRSRSRKETIGRSWKNKPLPRRNRSEREIKVLVPKPSLSQKRRRSIEAKRDREREPQDSAPWAMTEHNKLVPILQPVNRLNNITNVNNAGVGTGIGTGTDTSTGTSNGTGIGTNHLAFNDPNAVNGNGLSLRRNRMPTPKRGAPTSDYIVTGGYVVSPEVYYASLPLPDLPPPRHSEPAPVGINSVNRAKRDEVIHAQLKQNAEIMQTKRVKEYTAKKIPNRF